MWIHIDRLVYVCLGFGEENHVIYANLYSIHNKIHMTPNENVPKQINWIELVAFLVLSSPHERCCGETNVVTTHTHTYEIQIYCEDKIKIHGLKWSSMRLKSTHTLQWHQVSRFEIDALNPYTCAGFLSDPYVLCFKLIWFWYCVCVCVFLWYISN